MLIAFVFHLSVPFVKETDGADDKTRLVWCIWAPSSEEMDNKTNCQF